MTTGTRGASVRVAEPADIDAIVATLTTAFFDDPLWGPAFPDPGRRAEQAAVMWRMSATSALRYPWTLVTAKVEAAAILIPPGGTELTHEEEKELAAQLVRTAGQRTAEGVLEIYAQLEAAHPSEPHFYLTLLGTHSDHRGQGLGMGLLREALARIDDLGEPAYLESSNPANNARYESVGFRPHSRITAASGHVVTTMWRPAARP